jgi:phosphate transport system permease protein
LNNQANMQTTSAMEASTGMAGGHLTQRKFGDRAFKWFTLLMALSVFVLMVLIVMKLAAGAQLSVSKFRWRFLWSTEWDPVNGEFGALPCIFGTLVSSAIAMIIAVPLSIATAVFLTELAPLWMRQPLTIFIELLAAVPSVILGLWGIFVMVPWLRMHIYPWMKGTFSYLAIFSGPISGSCMLSGGIILAIMIIPIITSVSREILRSVPGLQREAAFALGATRWEVTRLAVLSYAKRGLFGAVILGLGRALGETMAVTMVIGNSNLISFGLFRPASTLASRVANEFTEATSDLHYSALFELGLVLLVVTLLVNGAAQLLLKAFAGPGVKSQH